MSYLAFPSTAREILLKNQTVTRRMRPKGDGVGNLIVGQHVWAIENKAGLGDRCQEWRNRLDGQRYRLHKLALLEITDIRFEPLSALLGKGGKQYAYTPEAAAKEMALEGVYNKTPDQYVREFLKRQSNMVIHWRMTGRITIPEDYKVARIQFTYIDVIT